VKGEKRRGEVKGVWEGPLPGSQRGGAPIALPCAAKSKNVNEKGIAWDKKKVERGKTRRERQAALAGGRGFESISSVPSIVTASGDPHGEKSWSDVMANHLRCRSMKSWNAVGKVAKLVIIFVVRKSRVAKTCKTLLRTRKRKNLCVRNTLAKKNGLPGEGNRGSAGARKHSLI